MSGNSPVVPPPPPQMLPALSISDKGYSTCTSWGKAICSMKGIPCLPTVTGHDYAGPLFLAVRRGNPFQYSTPMQEWGMMLGGHNTGMQVCGREGKPWPVHLLDSDCEGSKETTEQTGGGVSPAEGSCCVSSPAVKDLALLCSGDPHAVLKGKPMETTVKWEQRRGRQGGAKGTCWPSV